jgi:F0F1-type ATP synthase assembly protein I
MAQQKKHWARSLSDAMNLATTVASCVALGYFGGHWLDGRFDTTPWLTLVGFLVGVATGIKAMWQRAMEDSSRPANTEQNKDEQK